jgi:phage terminase large subunit-like protein
MNCNVLRWIEMVENGEIQACKDQHQLVDYVRHCFETEDIYTDDEQLEKYLGLSKYFPYERVFEWEKFCIALHLCTFKKSNKRPRWPHLFLLIGRGAGKDGFIALESYDVISPYNPIPLYDVDICAYAEEQAMRPVNDVLEVLDDSKNYKKLKKHFKWTKEYVKGIKNRGVMKGRTNNPKSKEGMRSGLIVFNEIHLYESYANIKVFTSGLGKRPHPRILYATTNGDVRGGPLDDLLSRGVEILTTKTKDRGLLPFICRLDSKEEADMPEMYEKANPSLPYLPDLMEEIKGEYELWKQNPLSNADFMTKRMNLPQSDADIVVTDWENIAATNRELPDMHGWSCTVGIDYAMINDWASVNFHFKRGDERFDINHSWLCLKSKELFRIKAPWREWAEAGYITLVDDVEINPDLLCEYIADKAQLYQIVMLAIDNFRYALMESSLRKIGFSAKEHKNVKLTRPSDIMKVVPSIDSLFNQHNFAWGDNPPLRWAANNTKLIRSGIKTGEDTGNRVYAKIEPKSRKTDPFMALVASVIIEEELGDSSVSVYDDIPVIIA